MLKAAIDLLTREQREKLHEFGIDSSVLSRWRTGKRFPTEVQAIFFADLVGIDHHKLQDEIALARATPEQRTLLLRVMGKLKRGAAATLSYGAIGVAVFAAMAERLSTMYRASKRRR